MQGPSLIQAQSSFCEQLMVSDRINCINTANVIVNDTDNDMARVLRKGVKISLNNETMKERHLCVNNVILLETHS